MATAAQQTPLETPRTRARRLNPPTIRAGSARGHGRRPDAYAGQPDSARSTRSQGPRREPPSAMARAGRNSFDTTPRQGGLPSGLVKPPPIDTEPPTPRNGRRTRSKDEDDDNRSDAGSVASMASVRSTRSMSTWDETPLHLAASSGSIETVKYFIGAGADKTLRDHMRRTPYNVAEDLGYDDELLALLAVEDDEEPVTSRVEPSAAPAPPPPPERAVPTKPPPAGAAANVVRDRRKTNIAAARKELEEALAL